MTILSLGDKVSMFNLNLHGKCGDIFMTDTFHFFPFSCYNDTANYNFIACGFLLINFMGKLENNIWTETCEP